MLAPTADQDPLPILMNTFARASKDPKDLGVPQDMLASMAGRTVYHGVEWAP